METVGLQERYREPEMVGTGVSNAELKITPELSGRRDASAAHDRPGRVSRVKGTHMMVCSNRWLNEAAYGFRPVRDGSLFASWKDIQSFSHTRIEIYHEWNGGRRYV